MKITSTNDERRISKALSTAVKTLSIFLMCFYNLNNAQNISNENEIHLIHGAEVVAENNIEVAVKNKIYVTSGLTVSQLPESDVEIVTIKNAKKSVAFKTSPEKSSKYKTVKNLPIQGKVAQTLPKSEETFSTDPISTTYFCSHSHEKTVFAQTQILAVKHFVKTDSNKFQIAVFPSGKDKIIFELAYYNSDTHFYAFSVRPPPELS